MTGYIIIALSALAAGVLQGVAGFGAGIVMMMFLPSFFAINTSAGIANAICILLCSLMAYRYRRSVNFKKIIVPSLLYLACSSVAILYSKSIDQTLMKRILGVFLIALSLYYLFFNKGGKKDMNVAVRLVCIIVSAVCDGLFGIGGPLMVLYFLSQTDTKEEYLGTIQVFFLVNMLYNTAFRMINGIILVEHLPYIGIGMLAIAAGLLIANRIVDRLNAETIKKIIYIVIGISGVINLF